MSDLLLRAGESANYLVFDGEDDYIDCGSDPALDNLPDGGAITVEAWARADGPGENDRGYIIAKGVGWVLGIHNATLMRVTLFHATTNTLAQSSFSADNAWHHWAFTFDANGDAKVRLWKNGELFGTGGAAAGAYSSDAADPIRFSDDPGGNRAWDGAIGGWARISNTVRYTDTFTPNAMHDPPDHDENTRALWTFSEGQGTTLDDTAENADGTISGATWGKT